MSKTIKKVLIILSVLCVTLGFLIFLALSTGHKFSYSVIEKKISQVTGLSFELIKPKTTFSANLTINSKAQYINIYNKDKTKKFISIKNPDVSFRPASIVFLKINFKKVNADSVLVNLQRNNKGEIDLLTSLKTQDWAFLKSLLNNKFLKKLSLTRLNSSIEKIEINFIDDYKIKSATNIILNNNEINISKKEKSLKIAQTGTVTTTINDIRESADIFVNIKSKYPLNNVNSKQTYFDVKLSNLNLHILSGLIKTYISKDIANIQGNLELYLNTIEAGVDNNKTANQFLIFKVIKPTLKLNNGKTIAPYDEIKGRVQFALDKTDFKIIHSKISSKELDIETEGKISKIFSKNPNIDLETKITDTQINNFLYFLPDNLIFYRPQGIPALKKSNIHALLNGNIKTKYSPLNITGNLKASDIHIPNYPKASLSNDLSAIFMKDKVRIYTRIYTPDKGEYVLIDGVSSLDNSLWGQYSVKSTNNIDLSFAKLYLVPVQEVIGFDIGPVPIMTISGKGNIDIKTKGTLNDAQIFGKFEAKNAQAELEGLSAKLTNGNCKLTFNNRDLIFDYVRGKIDGADFILTGTGNTKGEVNLNSKIKNAKTSSMIKILKDSSVAKPFVKYLNLIAAASGNIETNINLVGTIKDYTDPEFLEKLALSGQINLKNNKIILNNKLSADNLTGTLDFGAKQAGNFDLTLNNNSKINLNFESKTPFEKITKGEDFEFKSNIISNKLNFNDILSQIKTLSKEKQLLSLIKILENINFDTKLNIESKGKISLNKINPKNIKHKGFVEGLNNENLKNIRFASGLIKINNDRLTFDNFDIDLLKGKIKIKGNINNFLDKRPMGDLNIDIANIKTDNFEKLENIVPNLKIKDLTLKSGNITFKNADLKLNSLSADYQTLPVFLSANIKDIYNANFANAEFSTILNEKTTDNIINTYLTYPIKIKGEIPIKGAFRGNSKNYAIDFSAVVPKNSDVYYSGANLGDINLKREFTGRIEVKQNIANINNLRLIKYITNQNNKTNPLITIKANGQIVQKKDGLYYNNLRVATTTPINVRGLNLIFKKSLLKKGNLECNVNLNGLLKTPKINGTLNLQDLDIPLYDTQINNIKINIQDKFINGEILAKNKQSDVELLIKALNKFEPPYIIESLNVSSNKLNISDILASLVPQTTKSDISIKQDISIKPQDIIIKQGTFEFKDVVYDKISAQNLKGEFDYSNNIFNLKNIILDIAQGKIIANGKYSITSTKLDLSAKMENCDSNILTKNFLNLPDQMFGKVQGNLTLSAKNLNTPDGIKTLKSDVSFSVDDGKMPKLGSLEYLLRAGNLIKSGILGLSLNNVIQVLTPYKTGEFEKISGKLSISAGNVEHVEILSKGKNLSLYSVGSYSILENFADIDIYGKLSQNISNALGAIGNASLRQFFAAIAPKKNKAELNSELGEKLNKIPAIELENTEPRYFKVKVLGDINKENYIKNFNWINL